VDLIPVLGGGIAGAATAVVIDFLKIGFAHGLKERLTRLESELRVQSQLMGARLTRTEERRAEALSRLHTLLDRTLEINDMYIGSNDAGNPAAHVEQLRRAAIRSWLEFDKAFARSEIFLPISLAEKIRTYGNAIASARVEYEVARAGLPADAPLEIRLKPLSRASEALARFRSDVRPELVRVIRAALGTESEK
jgi:hypothetical protein